MRARLGTGCVDSPEGRGGRGGVDEDVVLGKLPDVLLELLHVLLQALLARLLAQGVEFAVVGLLLVLDV